MEITILLELNLFFLEDSVVYGNQDMLLKCDVVIRADIYSFGLNLECERV